jgi:hypothetical protein
VYGDDDLLALGSFHDIPIVKTAKVIRWVAAGRKQIEPPLFHVLTPLLVSTANEPQRVAV